VEKDITFYERGIMYTNMRYYVLDGLFDSIVGVMQLDKDNVVVRTPAKWDIENHCYVSNTLNGNGEKLKAYSHKIGEQLDKLNIDYTAVLVM